MSSTHHGLLLVNKPVGCTSHDVVAQVRKIFKTKEVGHSGTLDPLASGLMVLLIGEATKLSSYITEGDKAYQVTVRPGMTTDTLDITGEVLKESPVNHSKEELVCEGLKLAGQYELPIPMYSAKKVDGKKLYEYAREGLQIDIPKKIMSFWNVTNTSDDSSLSFHLECSKGSFIRSWVSLLGDQLGCGATMSGLHRTKSHQFFVQEAVDLEQLKNSEAPSVYLKDLSEGLKSYKKVTVEGLDEKLLRNGQISHNLKSRLIVMTSIPDLHEGSVNTPIQTKKTLHEITSKTDLTFQDALLSSQSDLAQVSKKQGKEIYFQITNKSGKLIALVGLEEYKGFKIKRIFNL